MKVHTGSETIVPVCLQNSPVLKRTDEISAHVFDSLSSFQSLRVAPSYLQVIVGCHTLLPTLLNYKKDF